MHVPDAEAASSSEEENEPEDEDADMLGGQQLLPGSLSDAGGAAVASAPAAIGAGPGGSWEPDQAIGRDKRKLLRRLDLSNGSISSDPPAKLQAAGPAPKLAKLANGVLSLQ